MSDEIDWGFSGSDNAKAEIRAAVGYLLKDAPGGDRGEIVWQVMAIVNQVARALPGGLSPLDDGMPGGKQPNLSADLSPRFAITSRK